MQYQQQHGAENTSHYRSGAKDTRNHNRKGKYLKNLVESDKITRYNKFGVAGVITTVIFAGVAIGTLVQSLFK